MQISQSGGVKPKMRERRLRIGVNWQRALEGGGHETKGRKTMAEFIPSLSFPVRSGLTDRLTDRHTYTHTLTHLHKQFMMK